jgi:hypothetical protein
MNCACSPSSKGGSSGDWHLCFRRDYVSVNGGLSGFGGVETVDLDASRTAAETLPKLQKRTAESQLQRFDAVTYATLTEPTVADQGDDQVRSAFTDQWLASGPGSLSPEPGTWLVVGANGALHLVRFPRFDGATASSPGAVELHQRPLP